MKLTTLLLLGFLMQVGARGNAQTVTMHKNNVSLIYVFNEFHKQTGYNFLYTYEQLEKAGKININLKEASLRDALSVCLKEKGLTYSILENTVIIKKAPEIPKMKIEETPEVENAFIEIKGKVTDEAGAPLAGATITLKETKQSTFTDREGNFSLKFDRQSGTLEITFVGYEPVTQKVVGNEDVRVKMKLAINSLDETVVIGYGTTSKRYSTGSVTSISSEILESQPINDPLNALQGRVPGLMVTSSSGMAGSDFSVRVRGENSISQGSNPLYIIDGVPFVSESLNSFEGASGLQSPLSSLNPNDIERIDVLKDADATAIYGSRGANGVILITTKSGKGESKVSFNVYSGISKINRRLDYLSTQQYLQMRKDAFRLDTVVPTEDNAPDLTIWDPNGYTDWQKLLIGGTGKVFSGQVSVSGGDEFTHFILSGNYRRESSVMLGNLPYQKGGVHLGFNHNSKNRKFSITSSIIYNRDENKNIATDLTQYSNLPPNMPQYNDDGSIYYFSTNENPLGYLNRTYNSKTSTFISNGNISYTLVKGLQLKGNMGFTDLRMDQLLTLPENSFNPQTYTGSSSQFGSSFSRSYILEPQVNYQRIMGPGMMEFLAGASWQQSLSGNEYIIGSGYSSDALLKDMASATSLSVQNSDNAKYRYQSVFGRINYNIGGKYILNGSFRRDGSSRFGPGNQFGNFGAIGGAWIFSEEDFFRIPWFSFGKLRVSYGSTGNDQIGNYQYLDSWSSVSFPYGDVAGLAPSRVFNPNYGWEVNRKFEAALDLGFIDDKLLISSGYYSNESSNQLVGFTLSSQAGFTQYTANLPAKVRNSGFELDISSKNIVSDEFTWDSRFNLSVPENKLLAYPELESSADAFRYEVGKSIRIVKGYHFEGIDPENGNPVFTDINKDGAYTEDEDYSIIGQTLPKLYGGLSNTLKYKNLKVDIFFQFVKQDAPFLDYGPQMGTIGSMRNKTQDVLGYWDGPGSITNIPRPTRTSTEDAYKLYTNQYRYSDAQWGDASYIRLKNVSVSYNLSSITRNWKIKEASVYLQGENLFTITKFKGLDPEVSGFDRRYLAPVNPFGTVRSPHLPPLRVMIVGLRFSL